MFESFDHQRRLNYDHSSTLPFHTLSPFGKTTTLATTTTATITATVTTRRRKQTEKLWLQTFVKGVFPDKSIF